MMLALVMICGIVFALGIIVLIAGFMGIHFGSDKPKSFDQNRWTKRWLRLLIALVVGVACLVVTRWIAVSVAMTGLVLFWPMIFGAAAESRRNIERLEALALWTESLRDQIASYSGLLEALRVTSARPPAAISREMGEFNAYLAMRMPLEDALRLLAQDINDVTADRTISALILASRSQGKQLSTVMSALALTARRQVEDRRAIQVEHQKINRSTQIIMIVTVLVFGGLAVFNDEWSSAFRDVTGQIVLAVAVASFVAGFAVLRQLARWKQPPRFLGVRSSR